MATITVHPDGQPTYDYDNLPAAIGAANPDDIIEISGNWLTTDDSTSTIDINIPMTIRAVGEARTTGIPGDGYVLKMVSNDHVFSFSLGIDLVFEGFEIWQASTGTSDEVIRSTLRNGSNLTFDSMIVRGPAIGGISQQDMLYHQNQSITVNAINSIFAHFGRCVFASHAGSVDLNINSCSFYDVNQFNDGAGGIVYRNTGSGQTININIFNSILGVNGTAGPGQAVISINGTADAENIFCDHCVTNWDTIDNVTETNTTLLRNFTDDDTKTSDNDWVIFEDITGYPYDLRIASNTYNQVQDAHSATTGANLTMPSVDVIGTARPQNTLYDIGFFEITEAGLIPVEQDVALQWRIADAVANDVQLQWAIEAPVVNKVYLGTTPINKFYIGSQLVDKLFLGAVQVWPAVMPSLQLAQPDVNGLYQVGAWEDNRGSVINVPDYQGTLSEIPIGYPVLSGGRVVDIGGGQIEYYNTEGDGTTPISPLPNWQHWPESTNYFLNSFAPVTQTVTGIPAGDVTVSMLGTGSITLSGDAAGTVTEGNPVTYTGTGASLTCTLSGTVTHAQVEPLAFNTPFIETAGSSVLRFSTLKRYPFSAAVFNQAEGMAILELEFSQDYTDAPGSAEGFISTKDAAATSVAYDFAALGEIASFDEITPNRIVMNWAKDNRYYIATRWGGSVFSIGFRDIDGAGAWQWSTEQAYSGSFAANAWINLFFSNISHNRFYLVDFYLTDQGTAWIEANY